MEEERGNGFSLAQEREMNLNAAASADASAIGEGASSEEPTSSSPGSGVSEAAAAAGTISEEVIAAAAAAPTGALRAWAWTRAASAISEKVGPEEPSYSAWDRGTSSPYPAALQAALACSSAKRSRVKETLHANLSSFVKHDSFYELCGLLGTKDIERSEFDVMCSKGMIEASGELGNLWTRRLGCRQGQRSVSASTQCSTRRGRPS